MSAGKCQDFINQRNGTAAVNSLMNSVCAGGKIFTDPTCMAWATSTGNGANNSGAVDTLKQGFCSTNLTNQNCLDYCTSSTGSNTAQKNWCDDHCKQPARSACLMSSSADSCKLPKLHQVSRPQQNHWQSTRPSLFRRQLYTTRLQARKQRKLPCLRSKPSHQHDQHQQQRHLQRPAELQYQLVTTNHIPAPQRIYTRARHRNCYKFALTLPSLLKSKTTLLIIMFVLCVICASSAAAALFVFL